MFTKYAVTKMKQAVLPADKTLHMGLLTGTPDEWGDNATEVSYPAYTRIPVVFDTVIDHHPTGNTNTGVFPQMDEGLAGLNVGYYGLYDAPTGGNLIEFGQLEENGQPTTETISPNRTLTMSVNSVWFGTMQNVPCRPAPCGGC